MVTMAQHKQHKKHLIGFTYIKIIVREIKQSFSRFIAIFAIVALGVGFLAGLTSATPDMQVSVDTYYDANNMADIFIKSTMGSRRRMSLP